MDDDFHKPEWLKENMSIPLEIVVDLGALQWTPGLTQRVDMRPFIIHTQRQLVNKKADEFPGPLNLQLLEPLTF